MISERKNVTDWSLAACQAEDIITNIEGIENKIDKMTEALQDLRELKNICQILREQRADIKENHSKMLFLLRDALSRGRILTPLFFGCIIAVVVLVIVSLGNKGITATTKSIRIGEVENGK